MGGVIPIVMRMEVSDEALATVAAEGDAEAFSVIVARHYDRMFGLAFRLTGRREEAEDLTALSSMRRMTGGGGRRRM